MNYLIERRAAAFAKATTGTRCIKMGDCKECTIRYCDYRSRFEAYIQGAKDFIKLS